MTVAQSPQPTSTPEAQVIFPQGEFWSDEPPLENDTHLRQIILLLQGLEGYWQDREDYYAAGNLTIYYSPNQKKSEDLRGPDFFVVLDTTRKSRRSWVVWQEDGKYPNVIIEVLSHSTAQVDRIEKKQIYQNIFRTPEYFWFSPDSFEFQGFTLVSGKYQPMEPNAAGRLWSKQLGLFLGIHEEQLRYFTPEGDLVPTPQEACQAAESRAVQAQQQAEKLAAKLKALGIDPNEV